MRTILAPLALLLLAGTAWSAEAVAISDRVAAITQEYQAGLEALAQAPALVANVKACNAKPLSADAAKALQARWISPAKDLAYARPYTDNPAAAAMAAAMKKAPLTKAFSLDAAGNVAATVPKCHDFIHGFEPKFTQPFHSGATVVNKPALDLTSHKASVQISVPIKEGGKTIGVLVGTYALDDAK
jgi:hypothetical protein